MIKALKISALALMLSMFGFQAQASEDAPAAEFSCNACSFKFGETATEAEAKQCADCGFSEIGDFGYGLWKAKCAKLSGDEIKASKLCRYAQKAGSKALFGYLAATEKEHKFDYSDTMRGLGKIMKNLLKVGDSLDLDKPKAH